MNVVIKGLQQNGQITIDMSQIPNRGDTIVYQDSIYYVQRIKYNIIDKSCIPEIIIGE